MSAIGSRGWPRLAEAGARPGLDLALAGRAAERIGHRLWAAVLHIGGDEAEGGQ